LSISNSPEAALIGDSAFYRITSVFVLLRIAAAVHLGPVYLCRGLR